LKTQVTYLFATIAAMTGAHVHALTLQECDRVTHVSHGGEADHEIVECGTGAALLLRTAEENMGTRLPFDRTDKALDVIARHEAGARAFATFERMAGDLDGIARDIRITTLTEEPCACAALYPEMLGDKTPFEVSKG